MDDADVVAVDEHGDAGSVEGSSEADVAHVAVDAETDAAVADAVVADAVFGFAGGRCGGGFTVSRNCSAISDQALGADGCKRSFAIGMGGTPPSSAHSDRVHFTFADRRRGAAAQASD